MKRRLLTLLIMISTVLSLTSCGLLNNRPTGTGIKDFTEVSRTVTITNKEQLMQSLFNVIKGEEEIEDLNFSSDDIIEDFEVNNYYFFSGAVYIQINSYMYRFQLDVDNKVVSYIKYTLEY